MSAEVPGSLRYDVAIIGGGIIGMATAMALPSRRRLSLMVVETRALTFRELMILERLVAGKTVKLIAMALSLPLDTVRTYMSLSCKPLVVLRRARHERENVNLFNAHTNRP